jgi:tetraacyldisaccharide 4'-kinase
LRAPDFWYEGRPNLSQRALRAALAPAAALYGFVGRLKERSAQPLDPGIPVICVGNLTAGGTGKTPLAIALARALAHRRPYLLTRGYGGRLAGPVLVDPVKHSARDVGDEALLLASAAPTYLSRDRRAGASAAKAAGAGLLIMDDGHQNFALRKTISLLVVDAERGLGNGRLIPAGPLREAPRRGLARADALVLMGDTRQATTSALASFTAPIFTAHLAPDRSWLPDGPLFAFAGIGRPEKFFATLTDLGCSLVGTRAFPDHHPYDAVEIADLLLRARRCGARLVTTQKDLVRIAPALAVGIACLPVAAVVAEEGALWRFLEARLPEGPATL